jgi:histidinol-phosphatase (PHP family)
MKKNDLHIHSEYSFDSNLRYEDIIEISKANGVKLIGFCEHFDDNFNFDDFLRKINEVILKNRLYIEIKVGLEISINKLFKIEGKLKDYFNKLDYIIWSNHDNYDDLDMYYEELLNFINNFDSIDIIGHIDFPFRFLKDLKDIKNLRKLEEKIDEILKVIISKNIVLEYNFYNFFEKEKFDFIYNFIWKKYLNLGGKYISLGSDSHNRENFINYLKYFKLFYNLLEDLNKDVKIVYFDKHNKITVD